ncbi:class II aldolase/adducin family protein [Pseudoruegeria sp. HB172150]|uniref:class II aldolase/adducin family protein n=1 Tax=Pseudoruegeria sp. HB172150 TaxID=2721164 RepID=UPI00155416F5|nr:class II aldolase/adducin family protein [Pseudoruegeria sp. HB172150]
MTQSLEETRRDLVLASRILVNEGVLDGFGHVSQRHPGDPERYLLPIARSPGMIAAGDVAEFTLDGDPVADDGRRYFLERVIHGAIYRARPDVAAIAHFHSADIMPFCLTGRAFRPVTHVGATVGYHVPHWSAQQAFGDTNLLVATREQGDSLAAAMGRAQGVFLANHGAVVVGDDIRSMTFRAIQLCSDARLQVTSAAFEPITRLTDAEIDASGAANLQPHILARAWDWWSARVES